MDIMKFGLNYITDPFITFFAGIMVLYTLFLFIDSISQKVSEKREDDFNIRFGDLFRQAKKPVAPEEQRDFSTIVEVENMRVKLEDNTRLYENILGKQYKEKEVLNNQMSVVQEEKAGLSSRLEESQNQNVSLQKETSDLKHTIGEMHKEHEQAQEEFRKKIEAIEKEHSAFRADMEAKLKVLGEEKAALTQDIEKTVAEKNALQEQAASLKHELENGRKEREKENNTFQAQLENLAQEKTALESDLNAKIAAREQEKTGLSAKLEKALSENEALKEQAATLAKELEGVKKDGEHSAAVLAAELEDIKKQYADLEKDAEFFKKQVAEVQAELRDKGGSYGESAEKLQQKIMGMEAENASLKTELSSSIPKEEYDIVKEKYDTVNAQLTQYRTMCMQLQSQLGQYRGEETIQDPSQMLQSDPVTKTLYEENKELSKKVNEYLDEIHTLRFDLQELMSVRQENEKLRIELGKPSAVKKPDIPKKDTKKAEERKKQKKQKGTKKKDAKKKKAGKAKKAKGEYEDNAVKMQMSGDSVDLALSDKDLIEEIEAPATPKTDEVPHIVTKEEKDSDKKGGSDKQVKGKSAAGKKQFNVFLPKLTSREKKEKAVPLIQEIAGLSKKEAEELVERIVIPIVKGVGQEEADGIKQRFKDAGILPRVREQV